MPTNFASSHAHPIGCLSEVGDEGFRNDLLTQSLRLKSYAYSLARDGADAEDLIQETLLKAWTHREQFNLGTNMQAWLRKILRNQFFTQHRRKRVQIDIDEAQAEEGMATAPSQEITVELRQVTKAIERSHAAFREVMILAAFQDLTMEEIAIQTGEPVGTIKSRLHRARAELRRQDDAPET